MMNVMIMFSPLKHLKGRDLLLNGFSIKGTVTRSHRAMTAEINTLKGQFKLDPKLSAIAGKGEEGDNKSSKKKKKDEHWKKIPPKEGEAKEGKQVGKYTFNWCEHHKAWTVHSRKTLQKAAKCRKMPAAIRRNSPQKAAKRCKTPQNTAKCCKTPQNAAKRHNLPQFAAKRCNFPQFAAKRRRTPQFAAKRRNSLQNVSPPLNKLVKWDMAIFPIPKNFHKFTLTP
jgi:hypothetical protein